MLSLNLSLSLASGSSRKGNVDKVICLGIFIVCAFADLLVRRSRDFKGLPTSINCTVFFFLAFSSLLYLKGTQNDYQQKPCFSKFVGLVRVCLCLYVHLSFTPMKVKFVERLRRKGKSALGARGPGTVSDRWRVALCRCQALIRGQGREICGPW